MWELEQSVYFRVSESLKIETNPLAVYNKHIWSFRNQCSLGNVYFFIATIALEITNHFSLQLFLKWVVKWFDVFDDKSLSVKIFLSVLYFSTFLANHLIYLFSTKDTLQQIFSWSWLKCIFKTIKKHIQELLCIFLLCCVCRLSIHLFKWEAESTWVVIITFRKFKVSN